MSSSGKNVDLALTAPLQLPAAVGKSLTTQGGSTLDDGSGNATIHGSLAIGSTSSSNPGASSTTAIVSGTPYHNTNAYDVIVRIPVTYSPTGVAAATLQAVISSSSPGVAGVTEESEPASFTVGVIKTSSYYVPSGYFLRLDTTNATLGTATIYPQ